MNKANFVVLLNFLICLLLIITPITNAQSTVLNCKSDIQLLNHLVLKNKTNEAIYLSDDMLHSNLCKELYDSIYFLKGFAFYQNKQFDSAAVYLQKVKKPDSLYTKAKFFASLNLIYLKKYNESSNILNSIQPQSENIAQLQTVNKAGISLLMRDTNKFLGLAKSFNYNYYATQNEENKLNKLYTELRYGKFKSPAKAALYSLFLPGSGKWYCKKRGQAVAAFITIAVLGAITAENVVNEGWTNYKSIIFLTTTGVFYIGNVYGSYYQAKQYNEKIEHEIDESAIYNIHVSLRNVYY